MDSSEPGEIYALLNVLRSASARIRSLEVEAHEALFSEDDTATHRQKLQEKAMILMDLRDTAQPYMKGIDHSTANMIQDGLKNFERRAAQALNLSSIFYLSSLLYPDDYKEGERNDLERFIDDIKTRFGKPFQKGR